MALITPSGFRHAQYCCDHVPTPRAEVGEQMGRLIEGDDVGHQCRPDPRAMDVEQGERLRREPAAVPAVRQPARDAADLGTTERQPVVVELLTECDVIGTPGVEGQVDRRPLGPETAQRGGQRRAGATALERHVGSVVGRSVPPPDLEFARQIRGVVGGVEAERERGRTTLRGRIRDDDLRGTVHLCQQPDQETDRPAARHQYEPALHPVQELAATDVRCSVQQTVDADGPEVGRVHAQQRVESRRQGHDVLGQRIAVHGRRVSVGHGHEGALAHRSGPAVGHPGDLHVSQLLHREVGRGPVAVEHAQLGVPADAEVRAGPAVPGELGAGRQPGEQRLSQEPAVRERWQDGLHDLQLSGTRHHERADRDAAPHRSPTRTVIPVRAASETAQASRWVRSASATSTIPGDALPPESRSTKARSTALLALTSGSVRTSPSRVRTRNAVSVISSATPSPITSRPAAISAGRTQETLTVPTAPDAKRSRAAPASGTSRPPAEDGPDAPTTSTTSPASSRTRSSRWVACSMTWPPDRSRRLHQAGAGVVLHQRASTRRTAVPASAERARSTVSRCRQWYPVAVGSPAAETAAATCSATLRSAASGFSTKNGNPARTSDSSRSPCANGGTHNQTASSPRVSRPVRSVTCRAATSPASTSADAATGSQIATRSTSSKPARVRACRAPTPPAPTSPTRTVTTGRCRRRESPCGSCSLIASAGRCCPARTVGNNHASPPPRCGGVLVVAGREGHRMRADVSRWLSRRTYTATDYQAAALAAAKRAQGRTVSVVLPALNEERTVGAIVEDIRRELVERQALVDELVVVDSGSTDQTAATAASAGARVVRADDVLAERGHVAGKGEALWKSLHVTDGDLVVFIDSDLISFDSQFVVGLLGPLLADPTVGYVKGLYDRPLSTTEGLVPSGGGRVTELTARPLLGALWPQLSGFVQPLSGEYAGRRDLLEQVPFVSHYGVELGLLIDLAELAGVDALAQVDLGTRRHSHQPDAALGRMAGQIVQTALARCPGIGVPSDQLVQYVRTGGGIEAVTWDVGVVQRPPMRTVPAYAARRAAGAPGWSA